MEKIKGNEESGSVPLLLQCVHQVATNFKEFPASKDLPAKIIQPLISLSTKKDPGNSSVTDSYLNFYSHQDYDTADHTVLAKSNQQQYYFNYRIKQ
jgi:hypothetical protein